MPLEYSSGGATFHVQAPIFAQANSKPFEFRVVFVPSDPRPSDGDEDVSNDLVNSLDRRLCAVEADLKTLSTNVTSITTQLPHLVTKHEIMKLAVGGLIATVLLLGGIIAEAVRTPTIEAIRAEIQKASTEPQAKTLGPAGARH